MVGSATLFFMASSDSTHSSAPAAPSRCPWMATCAAMANGVLVFSELRKGFSRLRSRARSTAPLATQALPGLRGVSGGTVGTNG